MPPQIHIFDLLAIVGLTWLALRGWRAWSRRRAPDKPAPGRWTMFAAAVPVLFLMAHLWAWGRPMPVLVETSRPFTRQERELWKAKSPEAWAYISSFGKSAGTSERIPFAYASNPLVSSDDVRYFKRMLAWGSWIPSYPRAIIVRSESEVWAIRDDPTRRQSDIRFHKQGEKWVRGLLGGTRCFRPTEPTILDYLPIDFGSYDQTF